jgi:hypothetical protein
MQLFPNFSRIPSPKMHPPRPEPQSHVVEDALLEAKAAGDLERAAFAESLEDSSPDKKSVLALRRALLLLERHEFCSFGFHRRGGEDRQFKPSENYFVLRKVLDELSDRLEESGNVKPEPVVEPKPEPMSDEHEEAFKPISSPKRSTSLQEGMEKLSRDRKRMGNVS